LAFEAVWSTQKPLAQTYREDSMKRTLLLGGALALAFGAGLATQSMVGAQQPPAAKTLMDEPLIGGIYEQLLMQEVSLPANANVPWHIHPDGHEITYVLDGEVTLKRDGQPDHAFKSGEGLHLNANVPHAAQAGPNGAKLLIVRLKPKDKPVTQPVPHAN
jgi:quercetin dioxygenase-like cupin family protein